MTLPHHLCRRISSPIEGPYCASIGEEIDCVKPNHYYGWLSFVMTICVSPHPISVHAPKMTPGNES